MNSAVEIYHAGALLKKAAHVSIPLNIKWSKIWAIIYITYANTLYSINNEIKQYT